MQIGNRGTSVSIALESGRVQWILRVLSMEVWKERREWHSAERP